MHVSALKTGYNPYTCLNSTHNKVIGQFFSNFRGPQKFLFFNDKKIYEICMHLKKNSMECGLNYKIGFNEIKISLGQLGLSNHKLCTSYLKI